METACEIRRRICEPCRTKRISNLNGSYREHQCDAYSRSRCWCVLSVTEVTTCIPFSVGTVHAPVVTIAIKLVFQKYVSNKRMYFGANQHSYLVFRKSVSNNRVYFGVRNLHTKITIFRNLSLIVLDDKTK